jgi:hypothetical protein
LNETNLTLSTCLFKGTTGAGRVNVAVVAAAVVVVVVVAAAAAAAAVEDGGDIVASRCCSSPCCFQNSPKKETRVVSFTLLSLSDKKEKTRRVSFLRLLILLLCLRAWKSSLLGFFLTAL